MIEFGSLLSSISNNDPRRGYPYHWYFVTQRFTQFLTKVRITTLQRQDGLTKFSGVTASLNRNYYGHGSETANSTMIGSWGKHTQVAPPRDVDILYVLPATVYSRFQERTGNIQSQLLQEVKEVLAGTYPQTRMRADGQVVIVPFNSIAVEVSPGFSFDDGTTRVCDTNNGGQYIVSTSAAEAADIGYSDTLYNGNTRALTRMAKTWQRHCNADDLKSFHIERLAIEFMAQWPHHFQSAFYYDWMVRDFFAYIVARANSFLVMPGVGGDTIPLGNGWLSRAETAHVRSIKACENERGNYCILAGEEWQEIFGPAIPLSVE